MDHPYKLLENRSNTSSKIVEEFAPKSLKKFLQIRPTTFKIAEELAPKSPKNLLQNRLRTCSKIAQEVAPKSPKNLLQNRKKTCSIIAEKLAQKSPENFLKVAKEHTPKWLKTCYKSAKEEIEKTRTRSRCAKNYACFQPLYGFTINRCTAVVRIF